MVQTFDNDNGKSHHSKLSTGNGWPNFCVSKISQCKQVSLVKITHHALLTFTQSNGYIDKLGSIDTLILKTLIKHYAV